MEIQRADVIGHPIGHTMSPFIHERLYALSGVPACYQALDVPDLAAALPALRGLDCFNITIPHKNAILPFLDGVDPAAKEFGSVNTVRVRDGKLYGYTTDGPGCRKALQGCGLSLAGPLLILGNGGAARAIAFEAARAQRDFHITIAHRPGAYDKAMALAEELAAFARRRGDRGFLVTITSYEELELDSETRFSLLLNATSVGMYPKTGESPVTEGVVRRCAAVFDAVYNPGRTQLLELARACGIKAVGGMAMLVYQAVAAHEIWYGAAFSPRDIADLCRDAEAELEKRFGGERP